MTVMKSAPMFRSASINRKILLLCAVAGTIFLLYIVRPLGESQVSRSYINSDHERDVAPDADYEVRSELPDGIHEHAQDGGRNTGILSSLRSLFGILPAENSGYSKVELLLDSNSEHLIQDLEEKLAKNQTNDTIKVTGIGSSKKHGMHILSSEEGHKPGNDQTSCTPGKTTERMINLFGSRFDAYIHPFIGKDTEAVDLMKLPPPFGLSGLENSLKNSLTTVTRSDFPEIKNKSCTRCVVVGNGGVMKNSKMGQVIDDFDVVIRLNDAPTTGHEKDVGRKTSIRMAYPESSFQSGPPYKGHWLYVLVIFKGPDLDWVTDVAAGKKLRQTKRFWKSVARSVPKPPNEFRIFNPLIVRETAELIGMKVGSGKMSKNVPTTGSFAISMAMRLCDEVSVAGFGYDESKPLHYYDKQQMKVVKNSWTHNIVVEKKWLLTLVQQGVIHDLTNGIK